jgi:hypothetical protein
MRKEEHRQYLEETVTMRQQAAWSDGLRLTTTDRRRRGPRGDDRDRLVAARYAS